MLCFGDSLTWGFDAETFGRFSYDVRWTGVLQAQLGAGYHVIEEGLNGRTTVFEDAFTPYQQYGVGINLLPVLLDSHAPLDLVILMLGTNDLQSHRHLNAKLAARGCGNCIMQIMKSVSGNNQKSPKILLISPPILKKPEKLMQIIFSDDVEESKKLSKYYALTAAEFGVEFLDAAKHVFSSDIDGIHLDRAANKTLGVAIAEKVKAICIN